MIRIKLGHNNFLLPAIITCLCFAFGKNSNIALLIYAGGVLSVLFLLFMDIDAEIYFICFLCANTSFVKIGSTAVTGYLAILCLIKFVFTKGKMDRRVLFADAVFLAFVLINCLINHDFTYMFSTIKFISLGLLLANYMLQNDNKKKATIGAVDAYVQGTFIGGIISLALYLFQGSSYMLLYNRYIGLFDDPNYYSAGVCTAISMVMVRTMYNRRITGTDLLELFLLAIFGLMTVSRAFIVCFALVLVLYLTYMLFSSKIKAQYKISIIVFSIVGVFFLINQTDIMTAVLKRFSEDSVQTGGDRIPIWNYYLSQFIKTPTSLFLGSLPAATLVKNNVFHHVEHNTFIQIVYSFGLIGSILYVSTFLSAFRSIRNNRERVSLWKPAMICIVSIMSSFCFVSAMCSEIFVLSLYLSFFILAYFNPTSRKDNLGNEL